MTPSILDRMTEILMGAFLAIFGWAWTIDRRVSKLETQQTSLEGKLNDLDAKMERVDSKLDRLIDKLL